MDKEGPSIISNFSGVELRLQKAKIISEDLSEQTYMDSKDEITKAVSCLQPPGQMTVLGLACTSFAFSIGSDEVDRQLRACCPGVTTTDMARAQVAAIKELGIKRLSLITPYIEELSKLNQVYLESRAGVEIVNRVTLGLETDSETSRVTENSIRRCVDTVNCEEAEAILIGCSAFRACPFPGFIDEIETRVGKPILTSTQCFLWHMLRLAGIEEKISGYGILLRRGLVTT